MSIRELQDIPTGSLFFLIGSPGAGKTTFSQQVIVESLSIDRPTILVSTEETPAELVLHMTQSGLREPFPDCFRLVDAFTQTVGLSGEKRIDTFEAHCADLNSIMMAISRSRSKLNGRDVLLILDSLTSPYLLSGQEVIRFTQLYLSKVAAEGNAVLVLMDEGVCPSEDFNALLSLADGIIRLILQGKEQTVELVKHTSSSPATYHQLLDTEPDLMDAVEVMDPEFMRKFRLSLFEGKDTIRPNVGDFVDPIWPNLCHWSGMFWDPKRFPQMLYELNKEDQSETGSDQHLSFLPLKFKFMFRMLRVLQGIGIFPSDFSSVANMKTLSKLGFPYQKGGELERSGIIRYLPEASRDSTHVYRIDESSDCYHLKGVGTVLASHLPPSMAGQVCAMEGKKRDWNAIETKCLGLGDPYCEVTLVPGEIDELQDSLRKESVIVERIHRRLIESVTGSILGVNDLPQRPHLGDRSHLHVSFHAFGFPHIAGRRAQTAVRMGGAKAGREIAAGLTEAGLEPKESLIKFVDFLERINAGRVQADEAKFRIEENIEPLRTFYMTDIQEPSCFFTTGFLNGFYNVLFGKHVRERRCFAAGDPHCEWEIL
jgi:predicted hydrocarbon binding protein/KaiC/GvpD/RAD55 family RecA-like ATPase